MISARLTLAVLVSVSLRGQLARPVWTPTGQLSGAGVCALAISPNFSADRTLWAGTVAHGLFVSRNGGNSWASVNVNGESTAAGCPLAVSPSYGSDQTLVDVRDQAYYSFNGGRQWLSLNTPAVPAAIMFSPSFGEDRTVAALADTGEVMISRDGGDTWQQVSDWHDGLPAGEAFLVYSGVALPGGVFLASTGDGIFRSADGGRTWEWSNSGLPQIQDRDPVSGQPFSRIPRMTSIVAATAEPPATVFAAAQLDSGGLLFSSTDAGKTWAQVGATLPGRPTAVALSPSFARDSTIYLGTRDHGVFVSREAGVTWTGLSRGLVDRDVTTLAVSPDSTQSGVVFAGTAFDGVDRYDSTTRRWQAVVAGMPQTDAPAALLGAGKTRYAGTLTGVFRSNARGSSWHGANSGLPEDRSVQGLALGVLANKPEVFAATSQGVFAARAGGGRWSQRSAGLMKGRFTTSIATGPTYQGTSALAAGSENGLFYSADGGRHWRTAATGAMNVTQVAFTSAGELYALCAGQIEGYTGHRAQTLPDPDPGNSIEAFAIAPRSGAIVAATLDGLYRYASQRWTRVLRRSLGPVASIAFLSARAVVAGAGSSLLRSNNAGVGWRVTTTPHHAGIAALARLGAHRALLSLDGHGVWFVRL